jgi:hypothetical protein
VPRVGYRCRPEIAQWLDVVAGDLPAEHEEHVRPLDTDQHVGDQLRWQRQPQRPAGQGTDRRIVIVSAIERRPDVLRTTQPPSGLAAPLAAVL